MEDFGENIKFIRENEEILLKLYNKDSATYFSIWLTSRGIDFRFVSVSNNDDLFYEQDDNEFEYLFWIKIHEWDSIKDEINWEE